MIDWFVDTFWWLLHKLHIRDYWYGYTGDDIRTMDNMVRNIFDEKNK